MTTKKIAPGDQTRGGFSTISGSADKANYTTLVQDNATFDALAKQGVQFVRVARRGKNPVEHNWPDKPRTVAQAKAHRHTGGNVGAMAGRKSGGVIWLDLDEHFREFLQQFPQLDQTFIVTRANAPDRGKLAIRVTDTLPTSTNWRVEGESAPRAELLSNGRQAIIVGIHETGAPILNNGKPIIEMSYADISAIWRKWTGQELIHPTAARKPTKQAHKPTAGPQQSETTIDEPDSLKARVKASWSAYSVFEHFGRVGEIKQGASNGDWKLDGNAGLFGGDPESDQRWHWFCHSDGIGGDQVDAWVYCTGRTVGDSVEFPAVLREMADTAGIEITPQPLTLFMRRIDALTGEIFDTPHELPFGDAMKILIAQFSQAHIYQGRTARNDRAVMLAMLERMRLLGRVDGVKYDIRSMAGAVNIHHNTSMKALRRLCSEYGYLEHCEGESWFEHELGHELTEPDEHTVNMFNAFAYRLSSRVLTVDSDVFQIVTDSVNSAVDTICHNLEHMDAATLSAYADCDAFAWGAREIGDPDSESIGKPGCDLIAALVVENDLFYADIEERTGMSRSTASKKARALAALGIVEIYREGRRMVVYLVSNWREILDRLLNRLTTYCRNIRRKLSHWGARVDRIDWVLNHREITSGMLEAALREMLAIWRRKLLLLRTELTAKTAQGGRLSLSELRNEQAENTAIDTGDNVAAAKLARLSALVTAGMVDNSSRFVRLAA